MNDFEKAKQLFIEGLQSVEKNNFPDAEQQFARSLELVPDRVSTLNNLSAIKIRLKKFKEAEKFARKAIGLEITSQEAWLNLGVALSSLEKLEDIENPEEVLRTCEQALELNASQHQVLHVKSLILKGLNQPEEARATYKKAIETRVAASPVFATARRATQKTEILVTNQIPTFNQELKSFETLHTEMNFPGQLARVLNDDYHFSYVFKSSIINHSVRGKIRSEIAPPDFIINNNANGEKLLSEDGLSEFIETIASFGVPVVNHPDHKGRVRQTA